MGYYKTKKTQYVMDETSFVCDKEEEFPLSSQEPNTKKSYHVRVDRVYGFTKMVRWTNVLKLQSVSIQRVDTPASIGNVKGKVLDEINAHLKKAIYFSCICV